MSLLLVALLLFQGLTFEKGSGQGLHQDTAYVVLDKPMELAAAWIALEDIAPDSGELMYLDGSHQMPEWKFGGKSKHFDPDQHEVIIRGEAQALPLKEFELLHILLANAGRVLPRETLIDRVWGSDYVGDTKTLDVHVKRLRSKIEDDPPNPTRIVTIRGLGYKYDKQRTA